MYYYRVYGLSVASDFELVGAESVAEVASPDVVVSRVEIPMPPLSEFDDGRHVAASHHEAILSWHRVGSFRVKNGKTIEVSPIAGVRDDLVAQFVTGASMGVLLHQRGMLVLHASAIRIDDLGAAFIGFKGMGKSTTVASLVGRGHQLIADDVVAIDVDYFARPGSSTIKLWPSAMRASLDSDPDDSKRIYPGIEKRITSIRERTVDESTQISAVYVLDAGDVLSIEPVGHVQGFVEAMRHSYAPRFVGTAGTSPEHFAQCTRFAAHVPMFRLRRVPDLDKLGEVAAAIENHFLSLRSKNE